MSACRRRAQRHLSGASADSRTPRSKNPASCARPPAQDSHRRWAGGALRDDRLPVAVVPLAAAAAPHAPPRSFSCRLSSFFRFTISAYSLSRYSAIVYCSRATTGVRQLPPHRWTQTRRGAGSTPLTPKACEGVEHNCMLQRQVVKRSRGLLPGNMRICNDYHVL